MNGLRVGVMPLLSPQTRVRMSINHLLIIAALPAHNEKVKLSDIAPEVVCETAKRRSEMIPKHSSGEKTTGVCTDPRSAGQQLKHLAANVAAVSFLVLPDN